MRFGMDYGGTNLKAGVFTAEGWPVVFRQRPLMEFIHSPTFLQDMIDFAGEVIGTQPVESGGLAIKGMVDVERGRVCDDIGAGSLLAGVPLKEEFSRQLGFPFSVDNDARAYAWGEWMFGAGRGARTMVCMTFGTGLGCTVVTHGNPYTGADQLGGLLGGHISIDHNGPLCPCGHRGCLELYCSATAIRKRIVAAHPEYGKGGPEPLAAFFDGVRAHNRNLEPLFNAIIEDFVSGIVNAIHAYSPDVVVLGGGVMKSADVLIQPITELVRQRAWTYPRGIIKISAAALGDTAAALGMAFHHHLDRT